MRIDSHHHFWQYSAEQYPWIDASKSILQRDFLPEHLRAELGQLRTATERFAGVDIDGVISVQARQSVEETRALLTFAGQDPWIKAVVGWVPLADPDLQECLEEFRGAKKLKAVRHVVQDEPDDSFILGEAFNRGVRLLAEFELAYDVLIYAKHLPNAIQFADRHPDLRLVLDHCAKPTIRSSEFDQAWARNVTELARRSNVVCKFSGLVTEVRGDNWTTSLLKPYWETVLAAFGPDRLMFGSDWPVCLLRTSYSDWLAAVAELSNQLSSDEQSLFWGETARRVYHL